MGYRAGGKKFRLTWPEGHDLEGLEIVARGAPIGALLQINEANEALQKAKTVSESLPALDLMLGMFGRALVSWNLEDDDGEPVPPGREGLDMLDTTGLLGAIRAWVNAQGAVEAPLGKRSTPTPPIPMTPLTETDSTTDRAS